MKLLLCAVNAKYIHSNLAIYSLKAYSEQTAKKHGWDVRLKEYTINHYAEDILTDIYKEKADVVVFSCYIWNMSMIYDICEDLKQAAPDVQIWLGGPEVSYDSVEVLNKHPEISLVMCGEGERTFDMLLSQVSYSEIPGITWRENKPEEGRKEFPGEIQKGYQEAACIRFNPQGPLLSMDDIPFVYKDMNDFEHKIVYYETSRGCPFSCSYCLSSINKTVRLRSLKKVYEEIDFFMEQKVPQVKFVDRTFNCNRNHARSIWNYLVEKDNGVTNFHFEVSADLITDEDIEIMSKMRPGLLQLEIGVQSTHEPTIKEIRRTMNLDKLRDKVAKVKAMGNIHQHLDLIAGLPYENLGRFIQSYNDVYSMEPDQLQLGFLKVLKGSYMEEKVTDYELVYRKKPVYEVISTKWMSFDDLLLLKKVEEMTEVYYNSCQFRYSLQYLLHFAKSPFDFYKELGDYYEEKGLHERKHNRASRYEILMHFAWEKDYGEKEVIRELLTYDLYLRENMKSRPEWAKDLKEWSRLHLEFFRREELAEEYIKEKPYDSRKAARQYHIEVMSFDPEETARTGERIGKQVHILFDYQNRNPLNADSDTAKIQNLHLIDA